MTLRLKVAVPRSIALACSQVVLVRSARFKHVASLFDVSLCDLVKEQRLPFMAQLADNLFAI